jgi:hypothetical protein
MNNIRKIIEERLENAMNDYLLANNTTKIYLRGQIEAYQDCLNLFPAPRTEQEILNDFEKLGYKVERGFQDYYKYNALVLSITIPNYFSDGGELDKEIVINLDKHTYECYDSFFSSPTPITIQEHKLLNELFEVWKWC